MCIKLVGLFTETLFCVIVYDPLVLFITFLMYQVLPMYWRIDSRCALERGGCISMHVELSYWCVVWNKGSN